ncbi:MAG: hypothetical protein ACXWV9_01435 [Flavisolibacter sp.]
MKPRTTIYFLALGLNFIFINAHAQKEFFRSQQVFSKEHLSTILSSIVIHNDLILFNANDYHLYAYNKKDGSLKWATETNYKSSRPAFVQDNIIYAGLYSNKVQQTAQFSLVDGKLIKTLPFGPLETKPLIKNGMLYGTAIYDYGCILAYDLEKDTVTWSRFIAHGLSNQPYYFDNKIMANAEGNNWVALGYDGILLDTICKVKADIFVENIPCIEKYTALSHDRLPIKGKVSAEIFGNDLMDLPEMITTSNTTFALNETKLSILSKKLKIKQQLDLSTLAEDLEDNGNTKLLKADDENIWILFSDHLMQYNHKAKKLVKLTNLSEWQPQTVLLDEENIWLISGKDGLLYGVSL